MLWRTENLLSAYWGRLKIIHFYYITKFTCRGLDVVVVVVVVAVVADVFVIVGVVSSVFILRFFCEIILRSGTATCSRLLVHLNFASIIASIIGVEVAGGASLMYRHRQMGRDSTSAQHLAWFL